ncbi:MAG: hypothetical protein HY899_18170 [Deltaproteobacteria bacterium]|nr:hypothetical protein [Deltaproteobacteria bacterium]
MMSTARFLPSLLLLFFIATFHLLIARPGIAAYCGDDVEGRRVACACGDTVIADTTLRADDPVVTTRCLLDGLILRASPFADSIRVDLAGFTITGAPYGVGILVAAGGASGAVISGGTDAKATILGFGTGVMSVRTGALARLENIALRGARRDGVRVVGRGVFLVDVEASDNSGDGIRLSGAGGRLIRTVASGNGGNGITIIADGTAVEAVTAGNAKDGAVIRGSDNDLGGLRARENGGTGLLVQGRSNDTRGLVSEFNRKADVLSVGGRGAR